ncbi:MAG: hypothetical protein EHM85_08975 [Desulfobacteraceae bacterium]|nr:MAG: hypothetical protein EHM85_08975 [Desulfobacteraceae bacterium]
MGKDFPFVEIPEHFKEIIGVPDPGTRLYRAYGSEDFGETWADAVFEICHGDGAVSPGGVAMYAHVTRPGVHKKLKSGGLTGFIFHVTKTSRFFKGKEALSNNANTYCYIPVSECKAWAKELSKKRDKKEYIDEVSGDGNWNDTHLINPPKHLKKKFKEEQKKRRK